MCRATSRHSDSLSPSQGCSFEFPGAEPHWARDRPFRVQHVRAEVVLDVPGKRIEGRCTTRLRPTAASVSTIVLDAVELQILGVTADGERCDFDHDDAKLTVRLNRPRTASDTVELAVHYTATPRRGLYFIAPDAEYPNRPTQVWSQGQDEDNRCWLPLFDEPHQKATSELLCTAPAEWTVLSNGSLAEVVEVGDVTVGGQPVAGPQRRWHFRQEVPHSPYLITLVAGQFAEVRETYQGSGAAARPVELSYLVPAERVEDVPRTFSNTAKMMRFLEELTGVDYPYAKYAQAVVAEFIFGGMENTSATTLTDLTLHDARAHLDYSSEDLIVHELAHQWFGNLLTCRDWSHGWLNEGFATYSECLWREHQDGRDEYDRAVRGAMEVYFGEAGERYRRPIVTNVFHEPIDVFDAHLYDKGAVVLHLLRRELGDEQFFRAIRHYVATHRTRAVITQDLANAVEEATGRNIEPFLSQWVYRAGHPTLDVAVRWEDEPAGLAIEVRQPSATKAVQPHHLPLEVDYALSLEGGASPTLVRFQGTIDQATQSFFVPLAKRPALVIVDPDQRWLGKVTIDKAKPWWKAELQHAPRAIGRSLAAKALGKTGAPDVVEALARALRHDPFWGVAADAAAALGAHRGPAARQALIDALTPGPTYVEHPKARRAAVRALAGFFEDQRATDALVALLERGDPSYFVESEALVGIGKLRTAGAFALLERHVERDSFQDLVRQSAYRGLGALRDPAAIEPLRAATRRGRHPLGRRAAVGALGVFGTFGEERVLVREHLERLLDDPDFRIRMAAVESLDAIADAQSLGALGRALARDLDGRVRRRSREVVRNIEERRTRDATVDTLREELKRLQQEHASLREQVAKLQTTLVKPGTPSDPTG